MKVAALLGNVPPHRQLRSAIRWLLDNGFPERADARVISLAEKRLGFGSGRLSGGRLLVEHEHEPRVPLYFGGSSDAGIEVAAIFI